MRRGELWTVAGGSDYAGKPRPALIVQSDAYAGTRSVTICTLTSNSADMPLLRLAVSPSSTNGLRSESRIMIDKITTVPRSKLGQFVGSLSDEEMLRVSEAIGAFLSIAHYT